MHTGISGNTRMYTLEPLTGLIFLLITSSAVVNCFAVIRTPWPFILIPQSPYASVVPFVDPPIGMGIVPLCRLICVTRRGASWDRKRAKELTQVKPGACSLRPTVLRRGLLAESRAREEERENIPEQCLCHHCRSLFMGFDLRSL